MATIEISDEAVIVLKALLLQLFGFEISDNKRADLMIDFSDHREYPSCAAVKNYVDGGFEHVSKAFPEANRLAKFNEQGDIVPSNIFETWNEDSNRSDFLIECGTFDIHANEKVVLDTELIEMDSETVVFDGDVVTLENLPITDPHIVGYLWNDGGDPKISTGE
jgi:hypothetical protein